MATSNTKSPLAVHDDSSDDSLPPVVHEWISLLHSNHGEYPVDFSITILDEAHNNLDHCVLMQEGHLALEARQLPAITSLIRSHYRSQKRRQQRNEDDSKHHQRLLQLSSCLLLVNPDHSTVWADRRRALLTTQEQGENLITAASERLKQEERALSFWQDEMRFVTLLMTQHSKAPSSWGHRKYVIQQQLLPLLRGRKTVYSFLTSELEHCQNVAAAYPKNYYAWTHRRWMWRIIMSMPQQQQQHPSESTSSSIILRLLQQEWSGMLQDWLPKQVGDHSAIHYAGQIMELILNGQTLPNSMQKVVEEWAVDQWKAFQTFMAQSIRIYGGTTSNNNEQQEQPRLEALWYLQRLLSQLYWSYETQDESHPLRALVQEHVLQLSQQISAVYRHQQYDCRHNEQATTATTNDLICTTTTAIPSVTARTYLLWVWKQCILPSPASATTTHAIDMNRKRNEKKEQERTAVGTAQPHKDKDLQQLLSRHTSPLMVASWIQHLQQPRIQTGTVNHSINSTHCWFWQQYGVELLQDIAD